VRRARPTKTLAAQIRRASAGTGDGTWIRRVGSYIEGQNKICSAHIEKPEMPDGKNVKNLAYICIYLEISAGAGDPHSAQLQHDLTIIALYMQILGNFPSSMGYLKGLVWLILAFCS
jgi:hypothetical protein